MGFERLCHFLTPTSANNYHHPSTTFSQATRCPPPSILPASISIHLHSLLTSGMPIKSFPSNYNLQEASCPSLSMDPGYEANVFNSRSSPWGAQFYHEPRNVDYSGITTAQLMGQEPEEYRDEGVCDETETMFEKPLTPSDVGKLNRLVIPKQHAERYFPLDGSGSGSSVVEPGEKGVQLSFEDEEGKLWRFRYSYWNSSQSYVLTKGWSRFVKEKRLDPGDIVSFRRERPSGEKLFIGWRRRDAPTPSENSSRAVQQAGSADGGPPQWGPSSCPANPAVRCIERQRDGLLHAGEAGVGGSSKTAASSKRLRLFGVNLDCPADASDPDDLDRSLLEGRSGPHMMFSSLQFSGSSSQT